MKGSGQAAAESDETAEDAPEETAEDAPDEAAAGSDARQRDRRPEHARARREVIAILEAVLLSVVTIVTAWTGYSAAKWDTESRLGLAHASSLSIQSNRAFALAAENRNFDASTFNAWFIAYTLGDPAKMTIAEHRFRPAFRVAFVAWRATDPDHNASAPPGPTYMPQYRQPENDKALRLDAAAAAATAHAQRSATIADDYVRITVVLAAVLFLVDIGSTFEGNRIRIALTSVGAVMLIVALVLIAQQPVPR